VVFLICGECEYRRTAVAICASSMFCVGLPCNACKQHVLCGFAVQCVQAACSAWVCHAMRASSMCCVGLPCNACKQHVLCGFAVQPCNACKQHVLCGFAVQPCNACKQHVLHGFAVQCVQAACSVWVCRADCCNAVMCEQFVLFGLLCESKCVLPGLSCVLRGLSCENKRVLSGLPCVSSVFCVGHLVRASRPFRLRLV